MRTPSDRRPSLEQIGVSFSRGILLGGGCIFALTIMVVLTLYCLDIQRDYGLGILFDDLGVHMMIGALVGGIAGIAASYFAGRLSKPIRILSLSLLLTYAITLTCSPIRQQPLAKQMMAAIEHKDFAAVRHLLNKGFDINRVNWTLRKNPDFRNPYRDCECEEYDDVSATALVQAVKSGDRDMVALLLQRGADVNQPDESGPAAEYRIGEYGYSLPGRYPLSVATESGDIAMMTLLLNHGADVNAASGSAEFALSIAAKAGRADIVQFLIQHGAYVHVSTRDGNTPLFFAAISGNVECGRLLLEHGVDVNAVNEEGGTALLVAAYYQPNAAFVSLLLDHGANLTATNHSHENALTLAAQANHLESARLLHSRGLPLHILEAASLNDAKALDRLLHSGEKLEQKDGQNMTPLEYAIEANNVPAVRLLLSRGAGLHPTDTYKTPMLMYIHSDEAGDPTEMIDLLVAHGCDINAFTSGNGIETATVLIEYVRSKNIKAVKALLKYHPDLTLQGGYQETALMAAQDSHEGNQEIADLLVKAGAQK